MAVENSMATETARVRAAVAAGNYKAEPGEHTIICKDRFGNFYNYCIFASRLAAETYMARLQKENVQGKKGCSFELFSGDGTDGQEIPLVMKNAWFVFLLFDKRMEGGADGKIEYLPIVAGDSSADEGAQWAKLRMSYNSENITLEDVGVIFDDCTSALENAKTARHYALMGAKCAITADLKTRLEQAEKEGA